MRFGWARLGECQGRMLICLLQQGVRLHRSGHGSKFIIGIIQGNSLPQQGSKQYRQLRYTCMRTYAVLRVKLIAFAYPWANVTIRNACLLAWQT